MSEQFVRAIRASGLSIYHSQQGYPALFIPNEPLEEILNGSMIGKRLNFPLRTRSKVLKTFVCEALGYPIPDSFQKTQPRFPGQNFDTYGQKSNNLQIWNEEVSASRRYVLVRLDDDDYITRVKVVSGEVIGMLDTTGTLTQKYQARSQAPVTSSNLVSADDTEPVQKLITVKSRFPTLMPIKDLFEKLKLLVGTSVHNVGHDQERNRGGGLHKAASKCLGEHTPSDSGQFPDIVSQLLEIKLQTSPTIDLGLVSPDGTGGVSDLTGLRHCDMRYAIFYGRVSGQNVVLDHVIVTAGVDFFNFFTRFGGKVLNKKLQIPLPSDFFD